jgi:hypothetical protein
MTVFLIIYTEKEQGIWSGNFVVVATTIEVATDKKRFCFNTPFYQSFEKHSQTLSKALLIAFFI